mmetsp:Transcript_100677/g.324850  ORF Transcript_100677/g.324850 Transcript_100677/m.324850 type:complete len:331 (+) Transcript_100677:44-1036(+)
MTHLRAGRGAAALVCACSAGVARASAGLVRADASVLLQSTVLSHVGEAQAWSTASAEWALVQSGAADGLPPTQLLVSRSDEHSWYDLSYDFTGKKFDPADPATVEQVVKAMKDYRDVAVHFAKAAGEITAELHASPRAGSDSEARQALGKRLERLHAEASAFEAQFISTLDGSIRVLPPPMQAMAGKQVPKVKSSMRNLVIPFEHMQQAIAAPEDTGCCTQVEAALANMSRHSKTFIFLNRQQAMGSNLMLKSMPTSWKPHVNTTLISEMGHMAGQTADSVEQATHVIFANVGSFARARLHCSEKSAAPGRQALGLAAAALWLAAGLLAA